MLFPSLSKCLLKLWGWQIVGHYPYEIDKKIFVVAPHTSNWDFPVGLLLRSAMNDKIKFIGKKSLFKPPLGWIMYPLGGIPVDRSKRTSFTQSVAELFKSRDRLAIAVAPEGTRKKVEKFKSGYYYMALEAGVPIIPTVFNWHDKQVEFRDAIYFKGHAADEMKAVEAIFRPYKGRNPENSFN